MIALFTTVSGEPGPRHYTGGLVDILRPDEEALFFPIGSSGACASALARTLRGGSEVNARVELAYARAKTFSLAAVASGYPRAIQEVVRSPFKTGDQ